jgi:hypothetical protein
MMGEVPPNKKVTNLSLHKHGSNKKSSSKEEKKFYDIDTWTNDESSQDIAVRSSSVAKVIKLFGP